MLSDGKDRNGALIPVLPASGQSLSGSRAATAPRCWQKSAFRRAGKATVAGGGTPPRVATPLASPAAVVQRVAPLQPAKIPPTSVVRPKPPTRAESGRRNRATPDNAAPGRHTAFPSRAAARPQQTRPAEVPVVRPGDWRCAQVRSPRLRAIDRGGVARTIARRNGVGFRRRGTVSPRACRLPIGSSGAPVLPRPGPRAVARRSNVAAADTRRRSLTPRRLPRPRPDLPSRGGCTSQSYRAIRGRVTPPVRPACRDGAAESAARTSA